MAFCISMTSNAVVMDISRPQRQMNGDGNKKALANGDKAFWRHDNQAWA
ncbi:hypothetical protein AEAC466_08405 [Asticcacaulis sp. AC466]|nr:hypothetical protein AEAC466_08405 [Asticcacaulis sp. AC466]